MPDDYPNDPNAFMDNPEREEEETKERSAIVASLPIAQEVIDWLDEWSSMLDSIKSIPLVPGYDDGSTIVELNVARRIQAEVDAKAHEFRLKYGPEIDSKQ